MHKKLERFLNEEEITLTDPDKINKDPESRIEEVPSIKDIFEEPPFPENFETLVNPITGEMEKDEVLQFHRDFAERGKDTIILKGEKMDRVPFYSVNRDEFTSYFAGLDEETKTGVLKTMKGVIDRIYTHENSELMFDDYMDLAVNNMISISSNDVESVDGPSKDVPGNVMKEPEKGE